MINEDDQFALQYIKEKFNVLKLQFQSRHISRKYFYLSVWAPSRICFPGAELKFANEKVQANVWNYLSFLPFAGAAIRG